MLTRTSAIPTLHDIKRHAKAIRKATGITHMRALDQAAVHAGFQNFRHAQNATPDQPSGFLLTLSIDWRDIQPNACGTETLRIVLSRPWDALLSTAQLAHNRATANFKADGPNSLRRPAVSNREMARAHLCQTARTFAFMDATGLRPSSGSQRAYPAGTTHLPGQDHQSFWYHPDSKGFVISSEPYESAMKGREHEIASWCSRHDFAVVKPKWAGMYNPHPGDHGGSRLYLFSALKHGVPLEQMMASLNRLPFEVVEATREQIARSPEQSALKQTPKPSKPVDPTRVKSVTPSSVPYQMAIGGPRRRPNTRMPLASHQEAGQLLKSVLVASYHRKGVYNPVNSVRCDLDDWVQAEYPANAEMSNEVFVAIYYQEGSTSRNKSMSPDERVVHLDTLHKISQLLATHYPDSPPLRVLQNKLNAAAKSLSAWSV